MRHLHIAFFIVAFALVLAVLLVPPTSEGGLQEEKQFERTYATDSPTGGVVCCTWVDGARTRTCAALDGQTCDVCEGACG